MVLKRPFPVFFTKPLDFVSAARRLVEVLVGLFGVGDAHVGAVPIEFLSRKTLREAAEKEGLCDGALHFEVGLRRRPAFACFEPLIDGGIGDGAGSALARRRRLVFGIL